MNRTNFEHLFIALIIQAIPGLLMHNWYFGALFASGIFLGREHAQREYHLGDPSQLVGYEALDIWRWRLDAVLDLLFPIAGVTAIIFSQLPLTHLTTEKGNKMPEKTLIANIDWLQVWLAGVTAMWGGLVSYFRRVQSGYRFSCISIIIHMMTSGFAGLICWLGCLQFEVPGALTAICTGLAGHMGVEFIKIVETRFISKLSDDTVVQQYRCGSEDK